MKTRKLMKGIRMSILLEKKVIILNFFPKYFEMYVKTLEKRNDYSES
jgi:hypothetical protein